MLRTLILSALACSGLGFAYFMSMHTNAPVPVSQPVAPPAASPFAQTIAGAGIVESRGENISIGTPIGGIVTNIFVKVGAAIEPGTPLFQIDNRSLLAQENVRRAAVESAKQKLDRLLKMPRAEDVAPARARVAAADSTLADAEYQLNSAQAVNTKLPGAMSAEEWTRRKHVVDTARARSEEAKAELLRIEAGAWAPDVEVARAEVASAEAELQAVRIELERLSVKSPIAGEVLKINIRKGEFASAGPDAGALMTIGDLSRMHVRVDIDESDIWRFRRNVPAMAMVRGNATFRATLTFEKFEPLVVPKRALTGDSSERVDTRVLQVIYSFDRSALPVEVGEQIDVFIDLSGAESAPSIR
ncbi:MAG: efflux RND transporter periplasmic adaptor subunit [Planctomycetes bacterium]|nr:efflux RND transporter periplasmic adaptor subunit [Planctomycetota bacterium]